MEPNQADRLRDFGQQVRVRREALDLTQEQAAQKAAMSTTTWSDAERGLKRPQGGTLRRMERVLRFAEGSLDRLIEDGARPRLDAPTLGGLLGPRGQQSPARVAVPVADSSEQIFALAANDELPLTAEERAEITRIAAAVWRRNHPENSDA